MFQFLRLLSRPKQSELDRKLCKFISSIKLITAVKKFLILIISIPFITNGQENKKNKANRNIFIGFSFSPDYAYRTLKNSDGSPSSELLIDSRNERERGKFSFTTGLNLNARLSKKIELQTGFLYSDKGFRIFQKNTNSSPRPTDPTHIKYQYSFNYLDVPLKLNFISGSGKVKFIAGAGLTANFLLDESETVTFIYADGSEKEYPQSYGFYNKFNLSSLISAGAEFKLRENIFLRAEPTFRYGLLKIIDNPVPAYLWTEITAYLWDVGLNMGIYYKFK